MGVADWITCCTKLRWLYIDFVASQLKVAFRLVSPYLVVHRNVAKLLITFMFSYSRNQVMIQFKI